MSQKQIARMKGGGGVIQSKSSDRVGRWARLREGVGEE